MNMDWMLVSIVALWLLLPVISYIDMKSFENPDVRNVMAARINPRSKKSIFFGYLRKNITEIAIYSGAVILARLYYLSWFK